MSDSSDKKKDESESSVSRRTFLGLAASASAALLAACGGEPISPTAAPTEAAAVQATSTAVPAALATDTAVLPTATASPSSTISPPPPPIATETLAPPTETALPGASPLPPTYTPVLATPTRPPPPTATPTTAPTDPPALDRASLLAHWPATAASRVVMVRHGGVWQGDAPNPDTVLQMLDAGLSTLAGVPDVMAVWRTLFDPGDRVLLKVNCIAYGGPSHPTVTYAVAQRLQNAGLQAENILIFDRHDRELESAGYTLNTDGPGVRCHGSRGEGSEARLSQATVRFYKEFDDYDAVVNLPIPKQHGMAGVSIALKNHYGSVDKPSRLHGNSCDPAIAELNAQPNLRDKTRLIVGAAVNVSPVDWDRPERDNALLLSFDPVALDTVARDMLVRWRQDLGLGAQSLINSSIHLRTAQSLNLGATDAKLIDLREVVLG